MTSKNHESQQIAFRLAHVLYPSNQDFLNIAAEQLHTSNRATEDRHEADLISWYIKYLGTSKTTKYLDMLSSLEEKSTNEKIKRYIEVVSKNLSKQPDDEQPYQFGQIALSTIHGAVAKDNQSRKIANFDISSIRAGMSIEEILTMAGSPDYVRGFRARTSRWGKSDLVSFHFRDKGVVIFSRNQLRYFTKGVIQPYISLVHFPTGEEYPTAQLIAGLRGEDYRAFLKLNGRLITKSHDLMMLLCDRVAMNGPASDKFEVAALQVSMRWIYHWKNEANTHCFQSIADANIHEEITEDAHTYLIKIAKRKNQLGLDPETQDDKEEDFDREE